MTDALVPVDDLDALIRRDVAEVVEAVRTAVEVARRLGRRLTIKKGRLKYGEWLPFLAGIGLPARTAQDYMRLASNTRPAAHLAIGDAQVETIKGALKSARQIPKHDRRMAETMEAWPGLKSRMGDPDTRTAVEAYVRLTAPVFYGAREDWPTQDQMAWVFGVERLFERDYRTVTE